MTTVLSPSPFLHFEYANGLPLVGGLVNTYQGGTSIPTATYTDSTGSVVNTNPVVCDAFGNCSIWLNPNVSYKYVITDAAGNLIRTTDNIISQQLLTLFGGVDTGAPNAYILTSVSPFASYAAAAGTPIYWVPSNNNSGASTVNWNGLGIVGIYNPNGTQLGANQIVANQLTGFAYQTNIANSGNSGFVLISVSNFTGSTVGTFGPEAPIASAATTDLGTAPAHVVQITGTTTITSLGASASLAAPIYVVRFTSGLTLTYNSTSLILPGAASIMTTPGDAMIAQYLGNGNWKVLLYQYSTGNASTKIKPSDTALTSQATLQPDPDLQSATLATGRYAFEVYLVFDSVAGGAGFKWTNDGTAVDSRGLMPALASGWVNGAGYGPKADTFYGTTVAYAAVNTTANGNQVLYKGSLIVGTPGTFGVSWAQNASTASATTLRAGSYLTTTLLNTGSSNTGTQRVYNTPGSFTETVPTGYNTLTIEIWGGSGNGGSGFNGGGGNTSGGGGGGSGAYSKTTLSVTGLGGDTVNFTVGASNPGTASSVANTGTLPITAMNAPAGGSAGTASSLIVAGAGGTAGALATGGTVVNQAGNAGTAGQNNAAGGFGGAGGNGVSGVYGGGNKGGNGGTSGSGTLGGTGLVIFQYS